MPLNTRLKTILKEYLIWVKWLQKKKKKNLTKRDVIAHSFSRIK